MYIDKNVPVPPNLPRKLQEDVEKLHAIYNSDDEDKAWKFDLFFDEVEIDIKGAYCDGKISRETGLKLFEHFGYYY